MRRKRNKEPMEIKLKNQIISYKENTQFNWMTCKLSQEEHIDRVGVKTKGIINTIKVVMAKSGEETGKS